MKTTDDDYDRIRLACVTSARSLFVAVEYCRVFGEVNGALSRRRAPRPIEHASRIHARNASRQTPTRVNAGDRIVSRFWWGEENLTALTPMQTDAKFRGFRPPPIVYRSEFVIKIPGLPSLHPPSPLVWGTLAGNYFRSKIPGASAPGLSARAAMARS